MYAVPKPGYDPDTMRAVAAAYRSERQAGQLFNRACVHHQPADEAEIIALGRTYGLEFLGPPPAK